VALGGRVVEGIVGVDWFFGACAASISLHIYFLAHSFNFERWQRCGCQFHLRGALKSHKQTSTGSKPLREAGGERRLDMRKVWSGQTIALTQLKSMAAKE